VAGRDLLDQALALPVKERAQIARELLRSLDDEESDDPVAIERAWTEEVTRRVDEMDAGTEAAQDWPTVRDELRATLKARRAGR
jgi:putative addiction module component (TIGR02574 family)